MKIKRVLVPLIVLLTLLLSGCPPSSPLEMKFRIAPEPIVGEEVLAIIKLRYRFESTNATLKLDASEGIHFSSEGTEVDVHLPADEWIEIRIPFVVSEEGVHVISAHALSNNPESTSFFGAGETLYIRSSVFEATVSKNELDD